MSDKPSIEPSQDGPYIVSGLSELKDSKGNNIDAKSSMALCRCGNSSNKPFCDGTHKKIGFSSKRLSDGSKDKRDNYEGKDITVHDNRGICAHAGFCTDGLPSVFKLKQEPWIDPDGAPAADIAKAAMRCPSGALSHSIAGTENRDQQRDPMVFISKNGPYVVTGGVELNNTQRLEGASEEHFTLCRCGASKNKPFCDGSHWYVKFNDEKGLQDDGS